MARLRFRKPKISLLISEIIVLVIWLYLGDQVIDVLDGIVGNTYDLNVTASGGFTSTGGCTNGTVFQDAYEILGVGFDCGAHVAPNPISNHANATDGLLGVIGLVMVVMVLMNFITYN